MIDTLVRLLPRCLSYKPDDLPASYALVTVHRPSNVDDLAWLSTLLAALAELSQDLAILFPVHPRTRQRISELDLHATANGRLCFTDPKPYLEFLALEQGATVVITDSGGLQEETSFLGVPCLTLRETTERPITVPRHQPTDWTRYRPPKIRNQTHSGGGCKKGIAHTSLGWTRWRSHRAGHHPHTLKSKPQKICK